MPEHDPARSGHQPSGRSALVTGAAGFIGSNLVDELLRTGWHVRGVDSFTPYYDPRTKQQNLAVAATHDRFDLIEADIVHDDLDAALDGCDVIFHLAAQPGVRASWSTGYGDYVAVNCVGTRRVLDAARRAHPKRVVFASSSSVYGDATRFPTVETHPTRPRSPYGVSKLAAEQLCCAYAQTWGLPVVSLRYFTVYGPRQRPDMAIERLIDAALTGNTFELHGDGSQIRDFTYVGDVVRANLLAADTPVPPGSVFNIAGGSHISLLDMVTVVEEVAGSPIRVEHAPQAAGDVHTTHASTRAAATQLGWRPLVDLRAGVQAQLDGRRPRPVPVAAEPEPPAPSLHLAR